MSNSPPQILSWSLGMPHASYEKSILKFHFCRVGSIGIFKIPIFSFDNIRFFIKLSNFHHYGWKQNFHIFPSWLPRACGWKLFSAWEGRAFLISGAYRADQHIVSRDLLLEVSYDNINQPLYAHLSKIEISFEVPLSVLYVYIYIPHSLIWLFAQN